MTLHFGPPASVFHERESEIVHIDVHVIPARGDRLCATLFTTGMSALPMDVPPGTGTLPHAELSMTLPGWWQIGNPEPMWHWPIRELIATARYPHKQHTWLGEGHTVASFEPPRPFDRSTDLSAMLLIDNAPWYEEVIDAEVPTALYELCPIYADELAYKRTHGADALIARLQEENASLFLNPDRPSVIPRAPGLAKSSRAN